MTDQKIKDVCNLYLEKLEDLGVKPVRWGDEGLRSNPLALSHVCWMAKQIISFVDEGRREKAFRWLGFMQGVLFSAGVYTIDEMKQHNMPSN